VLVGVGVSAAVYAASVDRYLLPKIRGLKPRLPAIGRHAHAH